MQTTITCLWDTRHYAGATALLRTEHSHGTLHALRAWKLSRFSTVASQPLFLIQTLICSHGPPALPYWQVQLVRKGIYDLVGLARRSFRRSRVGGRRRAKKKKKKKKKKGSRLTCLPIASCRAWGLKRSSLSQSTSTCSPKSVVRKLSSKTLKGQGKHFLACGQVCAV